MGNDQETVEAFMGEIQLKIGNEKIGLYLIPATSYLIPIPYFCKKLFYAGTSCNTQFIKMAYYLIWYMDCIKRGERPGW